MKTFIVKLIFQIEMNEKVKQAQFDEQTILIAAKDMATAFQKAKAKGVTLQQNFKNANSVDVNWKFIDVTDLFEINSYKDGEQLYTKTHEAIDSNGFIKFVKHRSQVIQTKLLNFA
jgi:hypothetical protein